MEKQELPVRSMVAFVNLSFYCAMIALIGTGICAIVGSRAILLIHLAAIGAVVFFMKEYVVKRMIRREKELRRLRARN